MKIRLVTVVSAWLIVAHAAGLTAQGPPAGTSIDLASLQEAAIAIDPRLTQLRLLTEQNDLRQQNISAAWRPSIAVEGLGQYQSDVPLPPFASITGSPQFAPPKAIFDSNLRIEQRLFDATTSAQAALAQAQLAEQQARVRTTLFDLRQRVNEAFFTAAALAARQGAIGAAVADLEGRLAETNTRVREGAALLADAAAIEATLLQRRQEEEEFRVARRVALGRLAILTGRTIAENEALPLPDVSGSVARARQASQGVRNRPEDELFARTGDRLVQEQRVSSAQERPRVSAFARLGFGHPGLNFLANEFDSYALGGVRLQWNAWTWGSGDRERAALVIQQQVVAADQAAFARDLDQAVEADAASIDRLQAALALDDRIVTLREQVERSMQVRFREGVVTAADLLDRSTELLQARSVRAAHEVELAQTGARLLTTLGLEVR